MSDDSRLSDELARVSRASAKRPRAVIGVVLVVLAVAGVGAVGLQMSLGMELYLNDDSETLEDWNEIQSDFDKGNVVFVTLETDEGTNLTDPETARSVRTLYETYYEEVDSAALVTSPAHPIMAGPGGGEIPDTREEVLYSLNYSFNEHRSNMGVISNLYPGIQSTEQYPTIPDDIDQEEFPKQVSDGEAMFEAGDDTGVVIVQYGDVEIPNDAEGELFGLLPPNEDEIVEQQVREATAETDLPEGTEVTVTGTPVFEEAAFGLMLPEMIRLFAAALAIILVLVVAVMRGRLRRTWRVALPLSSTLATLVMMLGMMGYVGYDFNAVMLAVLPVAMGLAIDYGLQVQSRYVEERQRGREPVEAAEVAARTTGRALAIVLGTTVIGLGSLLVAEVPPVRQFGVTVAFSVLSAMVLSVTLLVALLVTFDDADADPPTADLRADGTGGKTDADEPTGLERVFDGLSRLVAARSLLVVLVLGSAVAGGAAAYSQVDTKEDMLDYWPDIQERQDIRALETTVPTPNINYVIVETDDAYTYENFQDLRAFQRQLERHEDIATVMSTSRAMEVGAAHPPASGPATDKFPNESEFDDALALRTRVDRPPQLGLTPEDHPDRIIVQVFIKDVEGQAEREVIDYTKRTAAEELPERMDSRVTGEMVLNRNVIENVTSGLTRTTLLSFAAGAVFLALALRSGRESVLLVASVSGSALALTAGGMYLLEVPWNPLTVTTAAIILGLGIDYAVHVYERFREEVVDGAAPDRAMRTALVTKSRPVLGSGATTMLGFGVLIVSQFPVLSNFGVAIALAMGLAMVTAFVLLPAVVLPLARRRVLPDSGD